MGVNISDQFQLLTREEKKEEELQLLAISVFSCYVYITAWPCHKYSLEDGTLQEERCQILCIFILPWGALNTEK